jgi:hypothetical protein
MATTAQPPPALDTAAVLAVAIRAARVAGARIASFTGGVPVLKTKADFQDLVTATDRECQDDVLRVIREAFGDAHEFLGEEDVPPGAEASAAAIASVLARGKPVWVVDPIDGVRRASRGLAKRQAASLRPLPPPPPHPLRPPTLPRASPSRASPLASRTPRAPSWWA